MRGNGVRLSRPRRAALRGAAIVLLLLPTLMLAQSASTASAPSALQFNGTTSYVQVNDSASLRIPTNLTVEAWIKPTTVASYRDIVGKNNFELAVEPLNGGFRVRFEAATNGSWRGVASGQFALNQWYHVAGTYDGTTMRLFVNGAQVATKATTGNIDTLANPLYIATVDRSGDYFAGTIDEVRVSNVVRYTGAFTIAPTPFAPDAGTRGLWHFDERSGSTVADASGNGNTGTLMNNPAWTADTPVTTGQAAPPVISAVGASGITNTAATITWTTDTSATSTVEYGPTAAYGSSTGVDPALVTNHSRALSGLTANTLYHYRVVSQDASGNQATSGDVTFTTAAAPPIATTQGQWDPVMTWPVEATYMIQLYTGEFLMWAPWELPNSASARLWNPGTQTFTSVPSPTAMFCSGAAVMADGRVIVVGGYTADNVGIKSVVIFDPATRQWSRAADLNLARWYPSVVPLSDGRILALGGLISPNTPADPPEVYDPATNTWTLLTGARLLAAGGAYPDGDYLYPLSYLLPDGRVLMVTASDGKSWVLNVASQTWSSFGPSPAPGGAAAEIAPGKIIAAGGGTPPLGGGKPLKTTTWVVDMTQGAPTWRQVGSMSKGRFQHNLVTLPDGSVLAVGGADQYDLSSSTGVLAAELWDPTTESWLPMASMTDMRNYHSTAVLLPDGRVLSAGGGNSGPVFESAQMYSPPYLFTGARPTIAAAPATASYGAMLTVQSPDAASIASVVLVQMGAVTHTANMNARRVPLTFTVSGNSLTVQSPASGNSAPPGYYMLFLINAQGVPSLATTLRLSGGAPADVTPPTVSMSAPADGATISGVATVSATAGDDVGVASVQFLHDGAPLGAPVTAAPYSIAWDTTAVANGSHTLGAQARDAVGNIGNAATVAIAVANLDGTPPTISAVSAANVLSTSATIRWTTNEPSTSQVQYGTSASYGSATTLDPALTTSHSQTLTGLAANTLYHYRVMSQDASGNVATSGDFTFTTPPATPVTLLGDTKIESQRDYNPAGKAEAFIYTATASGTVNSLYVYIDSASTATQVVVGLYTNTASNNPNALLTQAILTSPVKGAWNAVAVPTASLTKDQKYWIAILGPVGAGTAQFREVGSGGRSQVSAQSNLTALPATWSPGTTYFNSPMSAYAVQAP